MQRTKKTICLLAVPRSGSSYVCDLVDNDPTFESHSELFHRKAVFLGVRHRDRLIRVIRAELGDAIEDYRDPRLVQFCRAAPDKFLHLLQREQIAPLLFFKIFPRHLDWSDLKRLVLSNSNMVKIALRRSPLATYVSQRKAAETKVWSHTDTSNIKVEIDAESLIDWIDATDEWFQACRSEIESTGARWLELRYEDLIGRESDLSRLLLIRKTLSEALDWDVASIAEGLSTIDVRPQQNRVISLASSISNYAQLEQRLVDLGRADLLRF